MKNVQHQGILEYVDELPKSIYEKKTQTFYLDKINSLYIYNRHWQHYQLISSVELIRSMHVPAKLSLTKDSKYLSVSNVNRTAEDGLNPKLDDRFEQHHLIDATKLDEAIDDLKKMPVHVPSKLDMKEVSEYITTENINRDDLDVADDKQQHHLIDATKLDETINDMKQRPFHLPGKIDMKNSSKYLSVSNVNREDLIDKDNNQQHFLIDSTRLEEKLEELPDTKYQHVPSKLDVINDKNKLLTAVNENRTAEDGLEPGTTDSKQQHHVIDAKGLNDLVELIGPYNHVPAILTKLDNKYDYLTVDNKNRTTDDGLPEGLEDYLFQKHILDTSKADLIFNSLEINYGTETIIAGASKPDDNTSIDIGDTSRFNDIKIYYKSDTMSVSENINTLPAVAETKGSFVLLNIGDAPITKEQPLTGEAGQTLCQLNDDLTKTSIKFYNTAIMRFQVQNGDGVNGAFNRIADTGLTGMQKNGFVAFGTVVLPYPSIGNGWLQITKITGVIYGTGAYTKKLHALIERLDKDNYVDYVDYDLYVNYVISSRSDKQLDLLNHLEKFETELRNEPIITTEEIDAKTRYDYLIEYREKLRESLTKANK